MNNKSAPQTSQCSLDVNNINVNEEPKLEEKVQISSVKDIDDNVKKWLKTVPHQSKNSKKEFGIYMVAEEGRGYEKSGKENSCNEGSHKKQGSHLNQFFKNQAG